MGLWCIGNFSINVSSCLLQTLPSVVISALCMCTSLQWLVVKWSETTHRNSTDFPFNTDQWWLPKLLWSGKDKRSLELALFFFFSWSLKIKSQILGKKSFRLALRLRKALQWIFMSEQTTTSFFSKNKTGRYDYMWRLIPNEILLMLLNLFDQI